MNKTQEIVYKFLQNRKISRVDSNNKVVTKGEIDELMLLLEENPSKEQLEKIKILEIVNYAMKTCNKNSPLYFILKRLQLEENNSINLSKFFMRYHIEREHRGLLKNKAQYISALRKQVDRVNLRLDTNALELHIMKDGITTQLDRSSLKIITEDWKK